VLLEVTEHGCAHGGERVEGVVLAQHTDGEPADPRHPPRVDLAVAGEHPEQRRLAPAVAADDADAVAAADAEGDGVEHLGGAEREGGALDRHEVGH
jgi:hypothetical protein